MNILLYARVSTETQTLEPQWLELRETAKRLGLTVAGEYSDVLSGGRAARPGLDAMIARCAAGDVGAVMAVKIDRLGRSVLNVVGLIERLEKMGVAVICPSQGIDTRKDNPCGRMQYQIIAAVAEFEKALIVERTVAGLKSARARGVVLGRPSAALAGVDVAAVVAEWRAGGGEGGYRELARLLGGCSVSTAYRVANAAVVEMEVA